MEKTATLNLHVNQEIKCKADAVLSELGLSMTSAINIYLKQIALHRAIPFDLALPKAPSSINADIMSAQDLQASIEKGLNDIEHGNTVPADVF